MIGAILRGFRHGQLLDVVLPLWSGPVPPGDLASVRPHLPTPHLQLTKTLVAAGPACRATDVLIDAVRARSIRMAAPQSRLQVTGAERDRGEPCRRWAPPRWRSSFSSRSCSASSTTSGW